MCLGFYIRWLSARPRSSLYGAPIVAPYFCSPETISRSNSPLVSGLVFARVRWVCNWLICNAKAFYTWHVSNCSYREAENCYIVGRLTQEGNTLIERLVGARNDIWVLFPGGYAGTGDRC
jgi:hypothetical protein